MGVGAVSHMLLLTLSCSNIAVLWFKNMLLSKNCLPPPPAIH